VLFWLDLAMTDVAARHPEIPGLRDEMVARFRDQATTWNPSANGAAERLSVAYRRCFGAGRQDQYDQPVVV